MSNLCYRCFYEYEGTGPCPQCSYEPNAQQGKYPLALQPGSVLGGKYIVGRVLGEGGFGITYAAQDYDSKELVAIKEHFPSSIVTRTNHIYVSLISESMLEAFVEGKEKFLAEARTLSQFNGLDNICDIYSYFEENGTAYFAMEYVRGIPLDEYIKKQGRVLSYEEATRLLLPVMDALSHVHEKGIIHRDIAPDNIMVSPDGHVMIIDFGAARYSMGEKSRSLDVILKHGFAPREQYARHGRQGAYTDVYAMAATYYYAITGKVPPDAIDRTEGDELKAPSALGVKMPKKAEAALMKALSVNFAQRYQSMADFADALKKELPPDKAELESQRQLKLEEERRKQQEQEEKKRLEAQARKQKQLEKEEQKRKAAEARRSKKSDVTGSGDKKKKPMWLLYAEAVAALLVVGFIVFAMPETAVVPETAVSSTVPAVQDSVESPLPTEPLDDIKWFFENGTLYIRGTGRMENYRRATVGGGITSPWYKYSKRITAVEISEGVSYIGSYAFSGLENLVSVSIPDSVLAIGNSAFSQCRSLRSLSLPYGLESISYDCFSRCSALESIDIPMGVKSIGSHAFTNCSSLRSVTFPMTVMDIDNYAFYGCDYLYSVTYKGTQEQMQNTRIMNYLGSNTPFIDAYFNYACLAAGEAAGEDIFWTLEHNGTLSLYGKGEMSDFNYAYNNSFAPWKEYKDSIRAVYISPGITKLGQGSFANCTYLSSVSLPDTLTEIGGGAFGWCSYLSEVKIPDSVSKIGGNAFHSTRLRSIVIPEGVGKIDGGTFNSCTSLTDVTVPDSVVSIGSFAFQYCPLSSIAIPDSVTSIGARAFAECRYLSRVDYTGSQKQWENIRIANDNQPLLDAELVCSTVDGGVAGENIAWKLTNDGGLYISGSGDMPDYSSDSRAAVKVPWYEYRGNINYVELSEGISSIGDYAFNNCNLSRIEIPGTVTSIGEVAFIGCSGLTELHIPEGVLSIGNGAFYGCDSLSYVYLPVSMNNIGARAFARCSAIESVDYAGTAGQWKLINMGSDNMLLKKADISYLGFAGGSLGESLSWRLTADGSLYITGNGDMPDFELASDTPWYEYRENVKLIEFSEGIASIGNYSFRGCSNVEELVIPRGVVNIGRHAFSGLSSLARLRLPASLTEIEENAFSTYGGLPSGAYGRHIEIYYEGSAEQWKKINIAAYNKIFNEAVFYYDS